MRRIGHNLKASKCFISLHLTKDGKWEQRAALGHIGDCGMPMKIEHEVYVNSIKVDLPSAIGNLSIADLLKIRANYGSPYTEAT